MPTDARAGCMWNVYYVMRLRAELQPAAQATAPWYCYTIGRSRSQCAVAAFDKTNNRAVVN